MSGPGGAGDPEEEKGILKDGLSRVEGEGEGTGIHVVSVSLIGYHAVGDGHMRRV